MKWIVTIGRLLFLALFMYLIITGNMMVWLALFAVSLIIAIFFGRLFCGYVCPMNTVMLPFEWLSKKLNIQSQRAPKWLEKGWLPWVSLGLSVALMLISKKLWHINLPILFIWLAIAIIVTLRYKPYLFHNQICPFGALQKTFGRFAKLSKRVDPATCIGCKKCEEVCPSNAIIVDVDDEKAAIFKELCHQCINCSNVCPTSAIEYSSGKE